MNYNVQSIVLKIDSSVLVTIMFGSTIWTNPDTVLSENNAFDPNNKVAVDIIAKKYESATQAEKGRLAELRFCFHGISLFIKHCNLYANVAFEYNTSLNVKPRTSKKFYNTITKIAN